MKKRFLPLFTFLSLSGIMSYGQDISLKWVKTINGSGSDYATAVVADDSGNVYTAGRYGGTKDFDPGDGEFELTAVGGMDVFIQKLDGEGNFVWAKSVGGLDSENAQDINISPTGDIYITGTFETKAYLNPDNPTQSKTSYGEKDVFILKLNPSGEYQWVKTFGWFGTERAYGIDFDSDGNFYIAGGFESSPDFDLGSAIVRKTAVGATDIFIAKYDEDANFFWVKTIGGNSNDIAHDIEIDENDDIFITGEYFYDIDFDPDETGEAILDNRAISDIFVAKYDSAGNYLDAATMGGTSEDQGTSLALDSDGNIFVTGFFQGTCYFNGNAGARVSNGKDDIFLVKLNSSLDYQWVKAAGSSDYDDFGVSVKVDSGDSIWLVAKFFSTVNFGPSSITPVGGYDVLVQQFDQNGNGTYVNSLKGTSGELIYDFDIDKNDNFYFAGHYSGNPDFDPDENAETDIFGSTDMYVVKWGEAEIITSLFSYMENTGVSAHPNPSSADFKIKLDREYNQIQATIRNASGNIVQKLQVSSTDTFKLNLEGPKGIYFMELKAENELLSMLKLVKN